MPAGRPHRPHPAGQRRRRQLSRDAQAAARRATPISTGALAARVAQRRVLFDGTNRATLDLYGGTASDSGVSIDLLHEPDGVVVAHWDVAAIPAGTVQSITWDATVDGKPAPEGRYEFHVAQAQTDSAVRAAAAPPAAASFLYLGHMFPVRGAAHLRRRLRRGPQRPHARGRRRHGRLRHAAGRGPRRRREVQGHAPGRRQLPRHRRRRDRRRQRLHAPARPVAAEARATRSSRASRSASSGAPATPRRATCTSRSGARPAGTPAATPSTPWPTSRPGTRSASARAPSTISSTGSMTRRQVALGAARAASSSLVGDVRERGGEALAQEVGRLVAGVAQAHRRRLEAQPRRTRRRAAPPAAPPGQGSAPRRSRPTTAAAARPRSAWPPLDRRCGSRRCPSGSRTRRSSANAAARSSTRWMTVCMNARSTAPSPSGIASARPSIHSHRRLTTAGHREHLRRRVDPDGGAPVPLAQRRGEAPGAAAEVQHPASRADRTCGRAARAPPRTAGRAARRSAGRWLRSDPASRPDGSLQSMARRTIDELLAQARAQLGHRPDAARGPRGRGGRRGDPCRRPRRRRPRPRRRDPRRDPPPAHGHRVARGPRQRMARRPDRRPRRAADPVLLAGLRLVAGRPDAARDGLHARDRHGRRLRPVEIAGACPVE